MTIGQVIDQIWQLPWYQVLIIAFVDDLIFMLKIWPVILIVILIVILSVVIPHFKTKKADEKKMKMCLECEKEILQSDEAIRFIGRKNRHIIISFHRDCIVDFAKRTYDGDMINDHDLVPDQISMAQTVLYEYCKYAYDEKTKIRKQQPE